VPVLAISDFQELCHKVGIVSADKIISTNRPRDGQIIRGVHHAFIDITGSFFRNAIFEWLRFTSSQRRGSGR
jgi:hypothetical protein